MFKLSLLILFTLLLFENAASDQLCSARKSDNSCICKRTTDETQTLVISVGDCARIGLQIFPNQNDLPKNLNLLDLSHNEIKKLDQNEVKFSSIALETLKLSYNYISSISDQFFYEIPNLRILSLSHNSITSLDSNNIFLKNTKLTRLDLSFNYIKTLEENILLPLVNLQDLDLSYNDIAIGGWLTETSNSLSANLGLNENIISLNLDNIGLKDLHNLYFSNYTNLKHLSLADNHFQDVPRVPYTVEYLDLSGSEISVLQAKHLSYHSLKTLKLERMKKLESIHPYAFYNLQALEELYIRNCHNLKEFNELIFGVLHKNMAWEMKRLSLSGNGFQTLNSTYKYIFKTVDYIDLTDNPWRCDCDLLWLQEFDNVYKMENVKCSSPLSLSSKSVFDITDANLPDCYPQKYGKKSHRVLISVLVVVVLTLSALVGYLIYYTPNWYGNRSRGVGPQSPYNVARTEED